MTTIDQILFSDTARIKGHKTLLNISFDVLQHQNRMNTVTTIPTTTLHSQQTSDELQHYYQNHAVPKE